MCHKCCVSLTYCVYIREFSNFKISPLFKGSADMISVHWLTVNQFLFEATLFRN